MLEILSKYIKTIEIKVAAEIKDVSKSILQSKNPA
jgi:hypothetical protein